MEAGVRDADFFVCIIADGYFTPNVRHEVACAVAMKKPLIILFDVGGPPLAVVLDQAAALLDPSVAASRGLRHLDAQGAADFKARALGVPVIEFRRDATLVTEAAPELLRALGGEASGARSGALSGATTSTLDASKVVPRPFRMRALRPLPGSCDALIVAAGDAALQALYIAEVARGACGKRALVIDVLLCGVAGPADAVVASASVVVLVLSHDSWGDATFMSAARAALDGKKKVVLVHEMDGAFGGEPVFGNIMNVTPEELKAVYSTAGLAVPLSRGAGLEALFVEKLLVKLGCELVGAPLLPPPPLPAGYKEAATAAPRADACAALRADSRPSAVALGGLGGAGKTTVAAAIAIDPVVVAAFDDVVWVTVGKVDHAGVVGLLAELLSTLEKGVDQEVQLFGSDEVEASAEQRIPLDPVAAMVQRLRTVCARRAVLIIVDDVWMPSGWAPDAASLLLSAVDVTPTDGGAASMALYTARDTDDRIFSKLAERAQRGLKLVKMGALEDDVAAEYLIEAAHLSAHTADGARASGAGGSSGPDATTIGLYATPGLDVTPILRAFGTLPLALTLAASCLRAEVEQDETVPIEDAIAAVCALQDGAPLGEGSGAPKSGAWLDSSQFCAALERANEHWRESDYVAIYRAIQAALKGAVLPKHYPKFATFGLLKDDVYAPEGVLAATWAMSEDDTRILLKQLQEAGLVKWEAQARRVVLHDLAHDFATAVAATQRGGVAAAHGALIDRCSDALVVKDADGSRVWWKKLGPAVDDGALSYVREHLPRHLREAGRGAEATALYFRFPWLLLGVRDRGVAEVGRDVEVQLAWERARDSKSEAAYALKLVRQTLTLSSFALEQGGTEQLAAQIIGRLGTLDGAAGGERVVGLVEEAKKWDGDGKAWLRPLRPNFAPPGNACEAVLEGHTDGVYSVCLLSDGRLASASGDKTVRVWDAASGACLRVLEGHTRWVTSVCLLSDGRLASASVDDTVRVWDAASGSCLEIAQKGSVRAAEIAALVAVDSDSEFAAHCGRTAFHFSPWGVSPVYLGAEILGSHLSTLADGRRVAFAVLRSGHVHVCEVVEPR